MKKLFALAAVAALLLSSCDKPEQKTEMTLPVYKSHHASLTLKRDKFAAEMDRGEIPSTIDLTSAGHFVLGLKRPDDGKLTFKAGDFTIQEAKAGPVTYVFGGYGSLTVKDTDAKSWEITYTTASGTSYETAATVAEDVVTGTMADDLCRTWKPVSITASAKGGDLPASVGGAKEFKGGDLEAIADYLVECGIKVDVSQLLKYNLTDVTFMESGKVFFNFKDSSIEPFVGTFSLKDSSKGNLSYDFSVSWASNPVIPVSGEGTVGVKDGKMSLATESVVTVNSKDYTVTLVFVCEEV